MNVFNKITLGETQFHTIRSGEQNNGVKFKEVLSLNISKYEIGKWEYQTEPAVVIRVSRALEQVGGYQTHIEDDWGMTIPLNIIQKYGIKRCLMFNNYEWRELVPDMVIRPRYMKFLAESARDYM